MAEKMSLRGKDQGSKEKGKLLIEIEKDVGYLLLSRARCGTDGPPYYPSRTRTCTKRQNQSSTRIEKTTRLTAWTYFMHTSCRHRRRSSFLMLNDATCTTITYILFWTTDAMVWWELCTYLLHMYFGKILGAWSENAWKWIHKTALRCHWHQNPDLQNRSF